MKKAFDLGVVNLPRKGRECLSIFSDTFDARGFYHSEIALRKLVKKADIVPFVERRSSHGNGQQDLYISLGRSKSLVGLGDSSYVQSGPQKSSAVKFKDESIADELILLMYRYYHNSRPEGADSCPSCFHTELKMARKRSKAQESNVAAAPDATTIEERPIPESPRHIPVAGVEHHLGHPPAAQSYDGYIPNEVATACLHTRCRNLWKKQALYEVHTRQKFGKNQLGNEKELYEAYKWYTNTIDPKKKFTRARFDDEKRQ